MHQELHNFERNQVWTLVEKPDEKHNVIGTKWVFNVSKMKMDKLYATRLVSSLKATLKLKVWTMMRHMPPLVDMSPFAYYLLMQITMKPLYTKWTLKVLF